MGISPGSTLDEHLNRYSSPVEGFDVMIFTGSGLMGREVINVRSSDIVIIAGGRSGTLGEFAIAYEECRPIGVLVGSGGIADGIATIVEYCRKPHCSQIVYESDPQLLLEKLLQYHSSLASHSDVSLAGEAK